MAAVVTLADAKLYLRVDGSTEDSLIQAFIDAAIAFLQNGTGDTYDDDMSEEKKAARNKLAKVIIFQIISSWYSDRTAWAEMKIMNATIMMMTQLHAAKLQADEEAEAS